MKKRILFQDTSFRDGFQSIFGARVFMKDFMPAVEAAAAAGITHFEAGGGARFQALYQNCGEDAFDMMDTFRKTVGPKARLQTLARGINVVALAPQPYDMIKLHAQMFKKHGMTRIRNFDALNDVNNLIYSGKCITEAGLEHEVVVTMMELPLGCSGAHDPEFYEKVLRNILDAGVPFASVCFKDASGTANPRKVYETFKRARKLLGDKVELRIHSHETCGNGLYQYVSAIEGGANGVDLARKPLSGGTSQPDLFAMYHALKGTDYALALGEDGILDDSSIPKIMEANNVAVEGLKDYNFPPEALQMSTDVIFSPMPGGALTANTLMMRETKTFHLYPEVIRNMSECVRRGGFASSVTPVSQFYFQQAFVNTVNKSKGLDTWAKMTEGYGKMLLGYQGKTPCEPDPELVKIAADQLKLRPFAEAHPGVKCAAEILPPGIPVAKKMLEENHLPVTDENIFIVGCLQGKGMNKGIDFLLGNRHIGVPKKGVGAAAPAPAAASSVAPAVNTNGMKVAGTNTYRVALNGKSWDVSVSTLK
ncbi:MAG: biotin attachment protein [Fibrobacteraceae bacterium]